MNYLALSPALLITLNIKNYIEYSISCLSKIESLFQLKLGNNYLDMNLVVRSNKLLPSFLYLMGKESQH